LPLFRGKERARSIRDIPEWERVMALLGERTGEEYEVAPSQLPLGIFGRSEFEILRDKKHHTVVYPSSLNQMVKFHRFVPEKVSLTKLDVGFAPDGTGTQLAGIWTSFVSRRFVDGFVACMKDVYSASWGEYACLGDAGRRSTDLLAKRHCFNEHRSIRAWGPKSATDRKVPAPGRSRLK